ncbi:unnamed protein product [Urochloa humidicola]
MEGQSSTLENYKIGSTIHLGSHWKVKVATNNLTGQKVAIKIIKRDDTMKSIGMEEKVTKEIEILRSFASPRVIKIYDVIETFEAFFVVMEYCENGELFDYVVSKGRLQEDEARRIFGQIISGVEYCHRNMVVHCDLRIENFLFDSDYNIKIANFEFSNIIQDGQFLNTRGGTTSYAAPEVFGGEMHISGQVDVWACGVVLYALLCGHLPFQLENEAELRQSITDGAYTIPEYVSASARDLISGMLVVDPNSRMTISEVGRHAWFQVIDVDT